MNNKQIYLILLGILLLGAILRLAPILTTGGLLREPDSYYYLSILQQGHGLTLPNVSALDGQPAAEAGGLYELALIPHVLFSIPIYTIMLWLAPLFALLLILLTFIFADQIFSNKTVALLAAFFVSVLPGIVSYGVSGAWRGDSFIGVFAIISLILLVQTLKSQSRIKKIIYSIVAALVLIVAILIWSGGTYVPAVFILSTIGLMGFYIIFERKAIGNCIYPIISIVIFAILFIYLSHLGFTHASVIASPTTTATVGSINEYIQETQVPTMNYVLSSYGFLAILGPAIFLSMASYGPIIVTLLALILMLTIFLLTSKFVDPKETKSIEILLLMVPLLAYLAITIYLNAQQVRFVSLAIVPISICMGYIISTIINLTGPFKRIIIPFIIIITLFSGVIFILTYQPADSINSQFISALNWLKTNTPANSTILTTWPDGSVVEAIANRHVLIDSVMADPYSYEQKTSRWFVTNESNFNVSPTPSYVLLRSLSLNQTQSLCEIAYINGSYCNRLTNNTFLEDTKPNAFWLWNSCNSIDCHVTRGNYTYFLEYSQNETRFYLIDFR